MKLALTIPLLASMLATTGCTGLFSTEPFVEESDAIVVPGLAGTWTNDGNALVIREKANSYAITYIDEKTPLQFTGRLTRVGKDLVIDVAREADEAFLLPLHFGVRVWLDGRTLRWNFLDLENGESHDEPRILTPPAATRETMWRLGARDRAYEKANVWVRAD